MGFKSARLLVISAAVCFCLQWGSKAFRNMRIIPPGSGIVHQVNLEYLARVVFSHEGFFYPDSLVGTDSHTTMIDGLGVLGWGEYSTIWLFYCPLSIANRLAKMSLILRDRRSADFASYLPLISTSAKVWKSATVPLFSTVRGLTDRPTDQVIM